MLPKILNDVIGPVMRGPSSSHTAASWRIAKSCIKLLNKPWTKALIEFDKEGAWATNYEEQGTVLGINAGLLDLDITDPRVMQMEDLIAKRKLSIEYAISSFETNHVNSVRISLSTNNEEHIRIIAASLGGGAFEIQSLNEHPINIQGDLYELMVLKKSKNSKPHPDKASNYTIIENEKFIHLKSSHPFPQSFIESIESSNDYIGIHSIDPIHLITSGLEKDLPYDDIASLIKYAEQNSLDLGDIGIQYEMSQSGLDKATILNLMSEIYHQIEESISNGSSGTEYKNRILAQQSHLLAEAAKSNRIPQQSLFNNIIANITAIMEVKSSMGVFVANPTAGSCGTVGGLINAVTNEINCTQDDIIKSYYAAGIVGAYFAAGPGFSAEEHGCQVECGAASAMAAAALSQLFGGTAKQSIDAASMALQNMIGLICDPVADRVEVPCLGKNISAALNAYAAATMTCAGYDRVIPFEEVLLSIVEVSKQMPSCVKCSGKGGLSITKTALDLKSSLNTSL